MRTLARSTALVVAAFLPLGAFARAQAAAKLEIAAPLHTEGTTIRDANNHPVRLMSANWYGFDQGEYVAGGLDHVPLAEMAAKIRALGFNSVRLPWSNQALEDNPRVPDYALKANPQLRGMHSMEIMDRVIDALAAEGLLVILDNHVSRSDWCCNDKDGNGLWYNREYPESHWIADWKTIVRRYKAQPAVVAVDLRNELRSGAQWGGPDPSVDWHAAAERGGDAVLAEDPALLIMVEGTAYSLNFENAANLPIHLTVPGRLVYSPHAYGWSQPLPKTYEAYKALLDSKWGFLQKGDHAVPIWMGEIGICQSLTGCKEYGPWFSYLLRYIAESGASWSYWALNGSESSGATRMYGHAETYGLLTPDYQSVAASEVLSQMSAIGLHATSSR
jgi:endoglucanase